MLASHDGRKAELSAHTRFTQPITGKTDLAREEEAPPTRTMYRLI
jgi:hypothetical protein